MISKTRRFLASDSYPNATTQLAPRTVSQFLPFGRQVMKYCELIHHGAMGSGLS